MIYVVTKNERLLNDQYKVITVDESLQLLSSLKLIGFDTETNGLDCHTKELLSMQFGCKDFQVVVDCKTTNPLEYKELLESESHCFLGWNLKFDLKFLFNYRIIPKNLYDGYLGEKLLYLGYPQGMHSMSLKHAGYHYLRLDLDKSIRSQIANIGLTPEVIVYGADDVKYLEDIIRGQRKELEKKDLLTAIEVENKFLLPLSYMEWCGMRVDVEKWKAKMSKDQERFDKAKEALDDWLINTEGLEDIKSMYVYRDTQGDLFSGYDIRYKVHNLNWNSNQQVMPILERYGIDLWTKSKSTGKMTKSMDAKMLQSQKDKCGLIPLYLEYSKALKVTSTYGQKILDQINPKTGRLHTNFQQIGSDTTRITSGGKDKESGAEFINFLNMPSDKDTRSCFVAEEGGKFISVDFSSQETCLMASMSNDEAMLKELNEGSGDIHSLTAYMCFPEKIPRDINIKDIKKQFHDLRALAKGAEFGIAYGGVAKTLEQNLGLTKERSEEVYNNFMTGFKGLKEYQEFRRKDWMDKGYILLNPLTKHKVFIWNWDELVDLKSKFNPVFWERYRRLKTEDPSDPTVKEVRDFFKSKSEYERQSINYPIQASGSMCLRLSMIYFFDYLRKNDLLFKVKICALVHDEFDGEAPAEVADEVAKELYNCMVRAGAIFCTRCKLDAEISYLEDGTLPTYWIH